MVSQVSFSPWQCCAAGGCVGAFMMWVSELLRSAKRMCKWSCKFVWIKIRYEKERPDLLPVHFLHVPNSADSEHFVFSTWILIRCGVHRRHFTSWIPKAFRVSPAKEVGEGASTRPAVKTCLVIMGTSFLISFERVGHDPFSDQSRMSIVFLS